MFAVAHDQTVTLWSLADLKLIHAFPSQAIGSVRSVAFVGEEGTGLVAGGEHGSTVWDLLTFEGEIARFSPCSWAIVSDAPHQKHSTWPSKWDPLQRSLAQLHSSP